MDASAAIEVTGLVHRYGDRTALDDVSFAVQPADVFGFLGPNGGGKTTLFRLLATLLPIQSGQATIIGCDVAAKPDDVRRLIGVTFQSPSLDPRLTVTENLKYHGMLYGYSSRTIRERSTKLLSDLGLTDRARDIAGELSGGLKRRVEIAKGLLHQPQVLLLDEPSTGLDPGARHDLWEYLTRLKGDGVTILVTTHLMEEAERCDRLGILDRGKLVTIGRPDELRASIGGDCLTIQADEPASLSKQIQQRFSIQPQRLGDHLRIERENGHQLLSELMEAFPESITSVSLGKPTLEDVFIQRTGHRFWVDDDPQ